MKVRLLFYFLMISACPVYGDVPDQITLYLPAFEGPGVLGQNVATVLNLRIWTTLRRKPWPDNPLNLDFGKGLIIWNPNPLAKQSHLAAEASAKNINHLAQMALWGKAYPYGDGIVVQSNMSIPQYRDFRSNRNEIWKLDYRDITLQTDIPRRRFEVASIVLAKDVIENYSLPSALKIYSARRGGEPIGTVGNSYRGIQLEPELGLAKVIADGVTGWVRLPQLGKRPTEVAAFVSGVIKIFRADWEGALKAMEQVINNPRTSTPLKIDAHLYAGMATEQLGKSGREHFETALALNPYAHRAVEYLLMGEVAALKRAEDPDFSNEPAEANLIRKRLRQLRDNYARLFSKDNQLMASIEQIVQ